MKVKTIYKCDRCGREFETDNIPTHIKYEYYDIYESTSGYVKKEYDLCGYCSMELNTFLISGK